MLLKRYLAEGLLEYKAHTATDDRGEFVKIFSQDAFGEVQFSSGIRESFFTTSKKNVLRGMHFQTPPYDHEKIVCCTAGSILDVVVDLRKASDSYRQCFSLCLNEKDRNCLSIPKGFAHGFLVLSDWATVLYHVTSVHNKEADSGVHWASIGFDWPVSRPVVSERDARHCDLNEYDSPF